MLRLETLGGLTLSDDGRHLSPPRRQLAILGLLAAAGTRGIPRDKLIGCLWPESSTENARHALEQLVYSVRRQLGEVLALIVACPARVDPPVADRRLKRRRQPGVERVGWLHVVVAIQ
jgi:DNA-binding SARP family transcriptional activator